MPDATIAVSNPAAAAAHAGRLATSCDLAVIILNYRNAPMTIDCLTSLEDAVAARSGRHVIVVDNASGDGSAGAIRAECGARGWTWVTVVESPVNGGFAAGNNVGLELADASRYLLLNNDTIVRPGAVERLEAALDEDPTLGLVGPRLEWPGGEAQISAFRFRSPVSEFVSAAATGPITRLCSRWDVGIPLDATGVRPDWLSFACVMIRREVVDAIGPLDPGYFMYFEDIDFCRRARAAGWRLGAVPEARVVHLRGGSSPVKAAARERARLPRYYYESRTRYFARFYGGVPGVVLANGMWATGRMIAWLRETIGRRPSHICAGAWRDHWTNWREPRRESTTTRRERMRASTEIARRGRPDFVIIGAMKCATTTLHDQLALQPGFFMTTPKEPNFFSDPDQWERGIGAYAALYAAAPHDALCGESSTHYTKRPTYPETVERLHDYAPDARLVYIMRHPIDRLVSHYIHDWTERKVTQPIDDAILRRPELVDYGRYAMQLRPFIEAYGRDRILPMFFDEVVARPQAALERVCAFLDYRGTPRWVEAGASNVSSERLRTSRLRDAVLDLPGLAQVRRRLVPAAWRDRVKRLWMMESRPRLGDATIEWLERVFDEDLRELGAWFGLDLTCRSFKAIAKTSVPHWVDGPAERGS